MLHADHPDRIAVSAGGDAAAFIIGPTPGGPTKATGLWYGPLSGQPAKISDLVPDTNLAFAPHGPAFALAVQDGEGSRLVVVDPAAGQADWAEHRLPVFAEQVAWTADALIVLAADPGADTASLTSGKPLAGGAEDPVVARAAGVARCVEDGIADPGRVAAMGASYGGYLTAWAIAGGTPFRCGVVIAGMSDLVSCWGTANNAPFYDYLLQGQPAGLPALYLERSPVTRLGAASVPTLILHGREDRCVPVGQAEELYAGLRRLGVPVEFVSYPREGHDVREPAHVADERARVLRWFGTHLGASS